MIFAERTVDSDLKKHTFSGNFSVILDSRGGIAKFSGAQIDTSAYAYTENWSLHGILHTISWFVFSFMMIGTNRWYFDKVWRYA